jgi:hypothetical protein
VAVGRGAAVSVGGTVFVGVTEGHAVLVGVMGGGMSVGDGVAESGGGEVAPPRGPIPAGVGERVLVAVAAVTVMVGVCEGVAVAVGVVVAVEV